jgi:hypothetical protein
MVSVADYIHLPRSSEYFSKLKKKAIIEEINIFSNEQGKLHSQK